MGCDIHLHIEIKVNGEWLHYNHPDIHRCYGLFSKMADVRNYKESYIKPISKPKGLPDDVTKTTHYSFERWGRDAHSESYLNSDEITELIEWMYKQKKNNKWDFDHAEEYFGYLFSNSFESFKKYPEYYPSGLEDFRFIFWFDN